MVTSSAKIATPTSIQGLACTVAFPESNGDLGVSDKILTLSLEDKSSEVYQILAEIPIASVHCCFASFDACQNVSSMQGIMNRSCPVCVIMPQVLAELRVMLTRSIHSK